MSDIYKLQYNGMTLAYPGWNGAVSYESAPAFKTLTLCASNGGTLTADTITGYAGDTVELTAAYNTYYRFSGYDVTGGTIDGNTFTFGDTDATVYAAFKPNAFTASGGFEKGSNQTVTSYGRDGLKTATIGPKYAITSYHTSNVPTSYYATSNRWKPPTGISAYKISLNPKMTVTAKIEDGWDKTLFSKANFASVVGSTKSNTQSNTASGGRATSSYTWNYNKSFTSNTLNVNYSISGNIQAQGYYYYSQGKNYGANATYIANNTNGTWTATGYIP